ncbi:MAG: ABC transporter substrate-binding protein, partial [Bacilli bacterium]|nr:ABC transporter substrate-binding protein [Bacilli bacterium]
VIPKKPRKPKANELSLLGHKKNKARNPKTSIYRGLIKKGNKCMNKMKLPLLAVLVVGTLNSITSCGLKSSVTPTDETITVTDMLGDSITIKKNPKKVACVSRATFDLLVSFGLGDKIDGAYYSLLDNTWASVMYPQSANLYSYQYEESYETFITRGVDLVFAPEKYIADGLKEHGINALCVSLYGNPTFDNYVHFFSNLVTKLWDDPIVAQKAKAWDNKVDKAINDVKSELEKHNVEQKKIFYVRGDKNKGIGYTDTKASFTEYAYRSLGFDFAGSHFESNKPSAEAIVEYNPDAFVIGGIYQNKLIETLKTTEPYIQLDAVKNNKIYTIPVGLTMFEQISVMTPIFFYDQANKIYPEYFNYDIGSLVKDTVKDCFGSELSDTQISYMLNGKNANGEDLA